ncbi:MAG: aminomethyl-transferring glycine dehydrogenase [Betaproteobacteria bacterium]|nr:aminomethyl-transferring glycine dehydrogenase [Betaproteobacteria bacterium]
MPMTPTPCNDECGFAARHIGPRDEDVTAMLTTVGAGSLEQLVERVVPAGIRSAEPLRLPPPRSEREVLAALRDLAGMNVPARNFLGQGYHGTVTPPVILRNVLENPAWYTAYTPYQPEISQGRLEALLNFQTMVCDLTGLDIANASLLDEATAGAEAMMMAQRHATSGGAGFIVSEDCHPQTIAVVRTRAEPLGIDVRVGKASALMDAGDFFGVLVQYPATDGSVRDPHGLAQSCRAAGALFVAACDPLSLALLAPPGQWGADIAIGSLQRFGVPMGFGGPHAAYLACRDALKRSMPGRLVGVSVDARGDTALRLALQTREQHIRREKATSNICTAQVLLAVMASMYAVYHGPEGLRAIARRVHALACDFAAAVRSLGCGIASGALFDTVTVHAGDAKSAVLRNAMEQSINLRDAPGDGIGVSFDETHDRSDVAAVLALFAKANARSAQPGDRSSIGLPPALLRTSDFLTHPVFRTMHSETEMLRYLRRLADRDLALDRTMIPLGSCTMKLNATTEMIPVTWEGFANLHPFAPVHQSLGYARLVRELERALCEITGYDAVSVQPNSGAQGEFAGLLAIRAWHRSRGEQHRRICLIPSSAHGTNPASAHMAGMEVVVVACDARGNVDVDDLRTKAREHAAELAALMVTYPSTHGVFEDAIGEICDIVHAHGGQVYLDGANLNALVGLARPGRFGADVSHLNLHKTFCIPHGGGGPGVGPVAVRAHLAPFLPGHPLHPNSAVGPVSAAPYGSASILPISWAYVALMGPAGLTRATQMAILNANYLATRLAPHFPILYSGHAGLVAHECILDLRPIKEATGISNEDVAKRLIDFGFHAPTMSFPVPGTLMVEPTESESKAELDRFVDAMIAIREEIRAVETGRADRLDNALRNAPHTAAACLADAWPHPYSREHAAFPLPAVRSAKYWPPVARVDNAYGDRHLVCACPPVEEYAHSAAG